MRNKVLGWFILRSCYIGYTMKILDASEPGFGKPMTENEVRDFLINSNKKCSHFNSGRKRRT